MAPDVAINGKSKVTLSVAVLVAVIVQIALGAGAVVWAHATTEAKIENSARESVDAAKAAVKEHAGEGHRNAATDSDLEKFEAKVDARLDKIEAKLDHVLEKRRSPLR